MSDINFKEKIQTIESDVGIISFKWENVREIPSEIGWFENVWKEYSEGKVFR